MDPVPLFREGLAAVVRRTPAMHWLGATGHLHTAVRLHERLRPDVLVVDSALDPQGHLATLLTGNDSSLVVVSLVREPHRTAKFVRSALTAGVRGMVPREGGIDDVLQAIGRTHAERTYLDPTLAPLAAGFTPTAEAGTRRSLSRREYEVLQLIADGMENQAVANELYVSVETVRTHVKNILRKLRARDRTHAVSLAYQAGLLSSGAVRLV
ncbi:response regulator transcription factor [Saccharothrix luteola]|uniref:response regulator transcription factor n=1 Tax=Saccharothrix luteola TaxID=2893018 RepID=UPI001E54BD85|nr:response regulator transcription factor [Saccharothrix luteola]MCC8249125.1 response regulator transcription factor [Saccharothrix luteola]